MTQELMVCFLTLIRLGFLKVVFSQGRGMVGSQHSCKVLNEIKMIGQN